VAWGEQDAFGHLNNVVLFRCCESVRMRYLERIGVLRSHAEEGISVILAAASFEFREPVRWPQRLTVRTGCIAAGGTSFTIAYAITDEEGDLVADGTSVQVMYDYRSGAKVRVPDGVRAAIAALQGAQEGF